MFHQLFKQILKYGVKRSFTTKSYSAKLNFTTNSHYIKPSLQEKIIIGNVMFGMPISLTALALNAPSVVNTIQPKLSVAKSNSSMILYSPKEDNGISNLMSGIFDIITGTFKIIASVFYIVEDELDSAFKELDDIDDELKTDLSDLFSWIGITVTNNGGKRIIKSSSGFEYHKSITGDIHIKYPDGYSYHKTMTGDVTIKGDGYYYHRTMTGAVTEKGQFRSKYNMGNKI